ncbi:MAG: glycoside hydrolase family 55 protein [Chthonomonadaceae bacterium]|nr:glycoside hydrolase family 55 protein [Chthonomonadaceae bacterium]
MKRGGTTVVWTATLLLLGALVPLRVLADLSPVRWNVRETGARGDGTTDDTAAFQQALDRAGQAGGGVVEVPAGRYRIQGHLVIPANVTLQGTFRSAPMPHRDASGQLTGTVLLAYAGRGSEQGAPFIRLAGNNAALAGVVIAYPEWKQTDVPPVPYPPCILSENTENVSVQDCLLLNPYEGIRLVRAHRHLVRNVTGYPIKRGLYVDECYDIGRIENVHYWPFGVIYKPEDPYCKWINTQGVAFEFARTDWHYVANTFCFGYGVGYKFSESKAGSTNGNFLGIGADSCERAVLVEQAQPPGLLITNGEFVGRWSSQEAVCVEVGPRVVGKVSLTNCSFWGPIDRCVWMRAQPGQLTLNACHFVQWDVRAGGSPALQLDAGRVIVQGCTFQHEGVCAQIGAQVVSAVLTGNQATGGFRVENRAGRRTVALANEPEPFALTAAMKRHYRIQVGASGDARYLRGWHAPESLPEGQPHLSMRWSSDRSALLLPVLPDRPYVLTLELTVPPQAVSPEAGIYLNGERLAALQAGARRLEVPIPPVKTDRAVLELRCAGWVPRALIPGSQDDRTLGVQLYTITMRAKGASASLFSAHTGEAELQEGKRK